MSGKATAVKRIGPRENGGEGAKAGRAGAWGGVVQEIMIGTERAVVVPYDLWRRTLEEMEELLDLKILADTDAEIAGEDEGDYLEHDEVSRMLGFSPLRYLRGRAGLTQTELARRSGLSQSYIAKVESNERKVSAAAAKKIAKVLKLSPQKIMA